jgi:nucleoside-diphosphate-sugar epimerase
MRIAVTGANGFLGRYVVEKLANHPDDEIFVYGRNYGQATNAFANVRGRNFDLFDVETTKSINEEVDVLVHLAWAGIPQYDNPIHLAQVPSHLNLIKRFVDLGVGKIFVSGTCFEYGDVQGKISEAHRVNPKNAYAVAKNQLRLLTEDLSIDKNFNLTWGRLFYLYGREQPIHSLFGALLMAASAGETSYRIAFPDLCLDYSPAGVMAGYIDSLIRKEDQIGLVNLGSGTPKALGLLAQSWIEEFGLSIELELGSEESQSSSFWADTRKLQDLIN